MLLYLPGTPPFACGGAGGVGGPEEMRQQSQRAAAPQTAVAVPRSALYWKSGPPDSHAAFSAALLWFAGLVGNGQHSLYVVFVACALAASGALGPLWLEHTCSSVNQSLEQMAVKRVAKSRDLLSGASTSRRLL